MTSDIRYVTTSRGRGLVYISHIRPRFFIGKSGKCLVLKGFSGSRKGGGIRGNISGFSKGSRRRLFMTVSAIPWDKLGSTFLVTLTYPGDPEYVPRDGVQAKEQLKAFRKRWERRWGPIRAVWKLEFQRRGAVHWMLAIVDPGVEIGKLRRWVSRTWYEIVGSGDRKHLKAGTSVEVWKGDLALYFSKYGSYKEQKEYQHQVPEWYESVGRFWGLWRLKPEWKWEEVSCTDFVAMRRVCVRYKRSKGTRIKTPALLRGMFIVGGKKSEEMANQLIRAIRDS